MKERIKLHFKDLDRYEQEYVGFNKHDDEELKNIDEELAKADALYIITNQRY